MVSVSVHLLPPNSNTPRAEIVPYPFVIKVMKGYKAGLVS
jgi:hypothetical protein